MSEVVTMYDVKQFFDFGVEHPRIKLSNDTPIIAYSFDEQCYMFSPAFNQHTDEDKEWLFDFAQSLSRLPPHKGIESRIWNVAAQTVLISFMENDGDKCPIRDAVVFKYESNEENGLITEIERVYDDIIEEAFLHNIRTLEENSCT